MPEFIRVESKDDGSQFDVAPSAFNPDAHRKVDAPAQWPDLSGETARPRPALYRTDKAGSAAATRKTEAGSPAPTPKEN